MHHLLTGSLSTPCKFAPVRTLNPGVSVSIEEFLEKALQDKIENRYSSAFHMKEALLACELSTSSAPLVKLEKKSETPVRVSEYIKKIAPLFRFKTVKKEKTSESLPMITGRKPEISRQIFYSGNDINTGRRFFYGRRQKFMA